MDSAPEPSSQPAPSTDDSTDLLADRLERIHRHYHQPAARILASKFGQSLCNSSKNFGMDHWRAMSFAVEALGERSLRNINGLCAVFIKCLYRGLGILAICCFVADVWLVSGILHGGNHCLLGTQGGDASLDDRLHFCALQCCLLPRPDPPLLGAKDCLVPTYHLCL